jgi:ketosteroid isomerase-like protein
VRSIFADWERGDYGSTEWSHSEIEFVRVDGPSPGRWTGLAGMAAGTRDWINTWAEIRFVTDEYRELEAERVLVLVHYSGRGRTSGLELGQLWTKGAGLSHVRDGKVTGLVIYWDRERALADLGLTLDTGSPG